jgi:pimeloyl-ACP methyl ester carboxylesterase
LQSYVDRVCQVVDSRSEPVVLVGHSMGGIAISQAAESRPEKIETLVYLCAFLLRDGESLFQVAQEDTESLILPNLVIDEDQGITTIRGEAAKDIFYGDCSDEDVARAKPLLRPDPIAPVGTPISVTEENFGGVPRVYVECLRDRAISPAAQKRMYEASPCERVVSMDASHSPFLSRPEELVSHLTSL